MLLNSSTSISLYSLYAIIIIPSPTATSAAAIAIENRANTCPWALDRFLEKAIKFRFAALAIISREKSMRTALRLTTRP